MQMKRSLTSAALLLGAIHAAQAHVTFIVNSANNPYAGKTFLATMNIPHGCADAGAVDHHDTIKVEVGIPSGITSLRPMDTTFGPAAIEKDVNGNIAKLIWIKSAAALSADDHYYQVAFRGTLPNTPLATLEFETTQTCEGSTTKTWSGADVPKLRILPARAPGWNKYTAQSDIDAATIKAFFADAYIVWSGGAAYSANTVTDGLISNKLTAIPAGAEYWVKY